jgi:HK97 family phage major capsid protein
MELTETMVAEIAAKAASTAIENERKANKVDKRFTPGTGVDATVQVVKDESDQPFSNLGEQLISIKKAGYGGSPIRDPRLKRCVEGALDPVTKAPTGMGETVPSDGGFMVAQEFIPTLLNRVWNTAVVINKCKKQPIGPNYNGFKIPAIDETSRANGSRWGGVLAYWASEGSTVTTSKAKIRQISLELQKLMALCYVTDEQLEDSVALEGYINQWFPMEFGFKLDDAVVNGDGQGKPLGIMSSPATYSVSKESNQTAATIVTNNILKMTQHFWAPNGGGIWLVNQELMPSLMTLTIPIGTAGALANLYQFPGMGATPGSQQGTMLGKPVYFIEQCQALGTVGDIILFNPDEYIIGDKGGINAASSIHVQFVTDQTAFRWTYRINGQPIWAKYITPFKGTNYLSPYISLATRA